MLRLNAMERLQASWSFTGKAESPLFVNGKLMDIVLDVGVDGANTVFDYDIP
ncbi:hypothetical protein Q0F98_30520 [Paenibacillus amylolyticus]|nr:hypothetical protein Q0F98_30520 [Paenibacillus amylolyticus]